jgi:glycosyltransferase involved in cell wall biosynthesis
LEALSCGTPVVVSEVVGIAKDVEQNGCGFTVKLEEREIARAIVNILESDDRSMGRRGRRLVLRKYSWHAVAREIEKVYFEALDLVERRC